jgi:glucosamine--fructose-6-phosphate aminotransferase (isomerizing)
MHMPMSLRDRAMLGDLRSRGALAVAIGDDSSFTAAGDVSVAGPDLPAVVAPIALAVAGQMLAESLARALGLNPDTPRVLNKVTQTDP